MKTYELMPKQQILYDFVRHMPDSTLNVFAEVELTAKPDIDLLKMAFRMSFSRLPYCSLRLHKESDGSVRQYFSEEKSPEIEVIDMSGKSQRAIDWHVSKFTGKAFPNHCFDVCLIKCQVLLTTDSRMIMLICGHHMAMDGYALIFFLEYLDKTYASLRDGTELPPEGADPVPEIEQCIADPGTERFRKNDEWWNDRFRNEPRYTSFNGVNGHELVRGQRYARPMRVTERINDVVRGRVNSELVQALHADAIRNHVSVTCYYLLGLQLYLASVCETDDITIEMAISGRSTLRQKACGLDMADSVFCRGIISENETLKEALSRVNIELSESLLHSKYDGTMKLIKRMKAQYGVTDKSEYRSILLSCQTDYDMDGTALGYRYVIHEGKLAVYPVYMHILRVDNSGDVTINYVFGKGYIKKKAVEDFHEFLLRFLPYVLEHPDAEVREAVNSAMGR